MIRSVHISRGAVSSPMPACLVFRYIVTEARIQRLQMVHILRQPGQLDRGHVDGVVDQRQAHRFLGGEVAAEGAGRDVGDRGDLLDGGLLEALPLAQLDGGVDQRGARALFFTFAQAEPPTPPTSPGTPGC